MRNYGINYFQEGQQRKKCLWGWWSDATFSFPHPPAPWDRPTWNQSTPSSCTTPPWPRRHTRLSVISYSHSHEWAKIKPKWKLQRVIQDLLAPRTSLATLLPGGPYSGSHLTPPRGAGLQNMSKWWPKGRGRSWEEGAALPVCPHCPPTSGSFLRTSLLPWHWPIPLPTHAKKCPLFRPLPRIASYPTLSARPLPWHSTVNSASNILCTTEGQVLAIGTVTSWPCNLSAQTHSYSTSHLLLAIIKTTFL